MIWLYVLGAYLVGGGILAALVISAPEGFQDERGFHYGRPPVRENPNPTAVKFTRRGERTNVSWRSGRG